MSYGLKGKVRQIVTSMDDMRKNADDPRDIGLRQFMAESFKDTNGQALTPEHLYSELGIEPHRTKVKDLMANEDTAYLMSEVIRDGIRQGIGMAQREQMANARASMAVTSDNGNQRFLSPDVFLDPVNRGVVQSTFYPDLIIREETVGQPTVTVPRIDLSDAELKDTGEAATIEEGSVTYGSKQVTLKDKARALKVTYHAIQFNSLSLSQIYFQDVGRILGHTLNSMAVDAIINGDQADASEAASVIGVENTTNGITWYDLARVAIQFGLIGRNATQAIGNATTTLNYMNLPEVKNKQFPGAPLMATMLRSPFTMPEELFPSVKVPTSKLVIQDPAMSLVQLTAIPLTIETDKIITKRIEVAVASIYTGFAKIQRNASVVIDGSITFSGNGFPAWMNPLP